MAFHPSEDLIFLGLQHYGATVGLTSYMIWNLEIDKQVEIINQIHPSDQTKWISFDQTGKFFALGISGQIEELIVAVG